MVSPIPNVNGIKFKVKEWFVRSGISNINSPECKKYVCEFDQKGRFVSSKNEKNKQCLGVWYNKHNEWKLICSIDRKDNCTFVFTPTKMSENNDVIEMEGYLLEAGTSAGILLNVVNSLYDIMPSMFKTKMKDLYSKLNSSLRKNTDQNLKVGYMTCKRIKC